MIRFTVLWRQEVVSELAAIWSTYPDRNQITSAADKVDPALSVDAHPKGNIPYLRGKAITLHPLTIYFRVDEADRKVWVDAIELTETN
jgi:hypothetical protein